jgi:hypothetical protein
MELVLPIAGSDPLKTNGAENSSQSKSPPLWVVFGRRGATVFARNGWLNIRTHIAMLSRGRFRRSHPSPGFQDSVA